jgi:hypothetical protein
MLLNMEARRLMVGLLWVAFGLTVNCCGGMAEKRRLEVGKQFTLMWLYPCAYSDSLAVKLSGSDDPYTFNRGYVKLGKSDWIYNESVVKLLVVDSVWVKVRVTGSIAWKSVGCECYLPKKMLENTGEPMGRGL